ADYWYVLYDFVHHSTDCPANRHRIFRRSQLELIGDAVLLKHIEVNRGRRVIANLEGLGVASQADDFVGRVIAEPSAGARHAVDRDALPDWIDAGEIGARSGLAENRNARLTDVVEGEIAPGHEGDAEGFEISRRGKDHFGESAVLWLLDVAFGDQV